MSSFLVKFYQALYFSSLEEMGFYLAILGLLLAIIQFGLPYSQPFVVRMLPKSRQERVSVVLNKILGFSAFSSIFIMPLLIALFIGKAVNTFAIAIGLGWANNFWVFFGVTVVITVILYLVMRWWWRKYIVSDTYKMPQTEMDMLKNEVHNLSTDIKSLTRELHELTEELKREKLKRR
jgi:hypothetical protein